MPFVARSAVGRSVVGRSETVADMQAGRRAVESTQKAVGHTSLERTPLAADSCTAVDPSVERRSPETVAERRAAVVIRL